MMRNVMEATIKKMIKYMTGILILLLFFLFIDSSGVGMKTHWSKIKNWAEMD